jgi:hypothetical protein
MNRPLKIEIYPFITPLDKVLVILDLEEKQLDSHKSQFEI